MWWWRERSTQEFPYDRSHRLGLNPSLEERKIYDLEQKVKIAEHQRDEAQERIDELEAIPNKGISLREYLKLAREYMNAATALAELRAVKADTNTMIYIRANAQVREAEKALCKYAFKLNPETVDFAEVKPEENEE